MVLPVPGLFLPMAGFPLQLGDDICLTCGLLYTSRQRRTRGKDTAHRELGLHELRTAIQKVAREREEETTHGGLVFVDILGLRVELALGRVRLLYCNVTLLLRVASICG